MKKRSYDDFKPLIDNMGFLSTQRFGRNDQGLDVMDLLRNVIVSYAAINNSVEYATSKNILPFASSSFAKTIGGYVASAYVLDKIIYNSNTSILRAVKPLQSIQYIVDTTKSTTRALSDAFTHLPDLVSLSVSSSGVVDILGSYFQGLQNYFTEQLTGAKFSSQLKPFLDLSFSVDNFELLFPSPDISKKISKDLPSNYKDSIRSLSDVSWVPVKRDDIVGNQKPIDDITTALHCLQHYNSLEKTNFFSFNPFFLFAGEPGTGKTMTARYALTLANELAKQNNTDIHIVELNFESKWQNGPVENIRKQLRKISSGDSKYVVFIDEIETKIPSREGLVGASSQSEVIGEFLRFRGGGGYSNLNNYLFVVTSNKPNFIDPAIRNVFSMYELQGPITPEEKLQVLQNSLQEGINLGYVQVTDWKGIKKELSSAHIVGRDIANIAMNAKKKYDSLSKFVPVSLSNEKKAKYIKNLFNSSNKAKSYITTTNMIYNAIRLYASQAKIGTKSYV